MDEVCPRRGQHKHKQLTLEIRSAFETQTACNKEPINL